MPAEALKRDDARTSPDVDLAITSYGFLARVPWLAATAWHLVVVDEAQAIKNPGAQQTRTVKQLRADEQDQPTKNKHYHDRWYASQVLNVQHGVGDKGARSKVTGEPVAGPETLAPQELAKNRADPGGEAARRHLVDDYYGARMVDFEKIEVPLLSAANWGGQGLHPRGNFEGYLRAGSGQKWLEVHGDTHFTHFYSNYGIGLQKRFFGHFLKGETTGWERQPPVALNIRRPGEKFALRAENEWPLARTRWTKYYLDPAGRGLATAAPTAGATLTYEATGDGLTFLTPPMTEEFEITGPVAAKIWLSSETPDADVFLVLRVFDPASDEVVFIGSNDPRTPVGLGWLRASQRKLDPHKTRPWRPYHTHDERWPLVPGDPVELDIEIWPTSIARAARLPAGLERARQGLRI